VSQDLLSFASISVTDHSSLHDTEGQAFYVSVRANNPKYNGHNVQLLSADPASFVVVDLSSPVLLLTLENGTLAAVGTNDFNRECP